MTPCEADADSAVVADAAADALGAPLVSGRPRRDGGGLLPAVTAPARSCSFAAMPSDFKVVDDEDEDEDDDDDAEADGNWIAGETALERLRRPATDAVSAESAYDESTAALAAAVLAAAAFAAVALAAVTAARAVRFRFADATRAPPRLLSALASTPETAVVATEATAEKEDSAVA